MILPGVFCPQYLPMYGPTNAESDRREKHKHYYLGLTQYLCVCYSLVTHGLNYQSHHWGEKTSVSVWYGTSCIFFSTQLHKHSWEKTLNIPSLVKHKESKVDRGPVVWAGHSFRLFAGYKFLRLPFLPFLLGLGWTQPWPSELCEGNQTNKDGVGTVGSTKREKAIKVQEGHWREGKQEKLGGGRRRNVRWRQRHMEKEWWCNEGVGRQESTMTLPYVSDGCYDPCTFVNVCSWECVETCSLSVISDAVISGEWQSCLTVDSCHPKHAPSSPLLHERQRPAHWGFTEQGCDGLEIIFITQVPGVCAWESMCVLKPTRLGLNKKMPSPGLSAWLPSSMKF